MRFLFFCEKAFYFFKNYAIIKKTFDTKEKCREDLK